MAWVLQEYHKEILVKYFEEYAYKIISASDLNSFITSIENLYPEMKSDDYFYKEKIDDSLQYINFIPKTLFNFNNLLNGPILLVGKNIKGMDWHFDSADENINDEITVLLYLNIDNKCGGEFMTKKEKISVKPGSLIVLPSNELHAVNEYRGDGNKNRISIKWIFKENKNTVNSYW